MASGDRTYIADKPTLDEVKALVSVKNQILTAPANDGYTTLEIKLSNIATTGDYVDIVNYEGSGAFLRFEIIGSVDWTSAADMRVLIDNKPLIDLKNKSNASTKNAVELLSFGAGINKRTTLSSGTDGVPASPSNTYPYLKETQTVTSLSGVSRWFVDIPLFTNSLKVQVKKSGDATNNAEISISYVKF